MTRAEFITILVTMFDKVDESAESTFQDVSDHTEWFYRFVVSAQQAGFAQGSPDGTFGPGSHVSREDMMTFTARALADMCVALPDEAESAGILNIFEDSDNISDYAKRAVAFFVQEEIVRGYDIGDGAFECRPGNDITRAEVSQIIGNVLAWLDKAG